MGHAQLHHTGHFLAKAHAAGAMDAAAHLFHADQRANVLVEHNAFLFFVTGGAAAVSHRQILQLAFTALVANRAVQRMVDEQKLHHRLLRLDCFVRLGANHHALGHRGGTSGHGFGGLFHFHQTHAAIGSDAELLVITKMRDESTGFFSGMHHRAAFSHFHFFAIEFDFNHGVCSSLKQAQRPCRSCA